MDLGWKFQILIWNIQGWMWIWKRILHNIDLGTGSEMLWKFKRRGKKGIVSVYDFDETTCQNLKILKFESYSEEWLDFILRCRRKWMIPVMILLWVAWLMIKSLIQ